METTLSRTIRLLPLALTALLVAPTAVAAHAELASTSPEAGAELDVPPDEVVLVFDGELDPQASGFVVTDATDSQVGAGDVDLDVAGRNELRGAVTIDDPGEYTVAWTVAAADGHPDEGSYTFTVVGAGDGSGGTPDTAVAPSRTASPVALLGLGLLLVATRLARIRAVWNR